MAKTGKFEGDLGRVIGEYPFFTGRDTLTEDKRKITCCFKEVKELFKAYSSGFASTASILADALNPLSKLNFSRQRLENDEEEIKKTFYKISKIFENLLATPVDNDLSSDLVDKVTFDSLISNRENNSFINFNIVKANQFQHYMLFLRRLSQKVVIRRTLYKSNMNFAFNKELITQSYLNLYYLSYTQPIQGLPLKECFQHPKGQHIIVIRTTLMYMYN